MGFAKVLDMLQKSSFEPLRHADLKFLTYKIVFLTAITTFRRCSDIQALRIGDGFVNVQKKGITFLRPGLSKQDRPNHYGRKIFVPYFKDNKKLDPKRALAIYLKRTEEMRKDEVKLFLATVKPFKPVTAQTISKWIVNTIKMAYENKDFKVRAHKIHWPFLGFIQWCEYEKHFRICRLVYRYNFYQILSEECRCESPILKNFFLRCAAKKKKKREFVYM